MWLLWEEDYTMSKKYLHHWSNKQDGIRNKLKKDKIYESIMKVLTMKMGMYNLVHIIIVCFTNYMH
jgi:hypothetical protein